MTNKEAIEQLKDWTPWDNVRDVDRFNEAIDLAIKALETVGNSEQVTEENSTVGDLISREYVKKAIADLVVGGEKHIEEAGEGNEWINGIYSAYREIDNAPTVKAFTTEDIMRAEQAGFETGVNERPKGKWIMNKTSIRGRNYTCTKCENKSRNAFHYCPNCGADMRTREEQE